MTVGYRSANPESPTLSAHIVQRGGFVKNISQRTALLGLVFGVLAVPALVLASTAVLDSGDTTVEAVRTTEMAQSARDVVSAPAPTTLPPIVDADDASAELNADLALACGAEGDELVALEASGGNTPLEQAALDALRPICAEAGLPLADAARPETVVIIETVMTVPVQPAPSPTSGDEDREDHGEDGDERDDHDEDDDKRDDDDGDGD